MPAWLTTKVWGFLGVWLGVFAILYGAYSWSFNRGAHSRDAEVHALAGTIANLEDASAQAQLETHAYVTRINALQDQVTKDQENAKAVRLAAGSAAIDAYIRLHPAPKAASGSARQAGTPGVSSPASQPDAAPDAAVVSRADLNACNDAFTTAVGLQDWVRAQASIDRNPK